MEGGGQIPLFFFLLCLTVFFEIVVINPEYFSERLQFLTVLTVNVLPPSVKFSFSESEVGDGVRLN